MAPDGIGNEFHASDLNETAFDTTVSSIKPPRRYIIFAIIQRQKCERYRPDVKRPVHPALATLAG